MQYFYCSIKVVLCVIQGLVLKYCSIKILQYNCFVISTKSTHIQLLCNIQQALKKNPPYIFVRNKPEAKVFFLLGLSCYLYLPAESIFACF